MTRESELLLECRNGNKEAFYELVEPHLKKAYQTAYAILHAHHEAEDAVQNSLIEVYKTVMSQKELHTFGGWFHQLVVHRSVDLVRRKMKEFEHNATAEVLPLIATDEPLPIHQLIDAEDQETLLAHILSLNISHRAVIVLYYFQERSVQEIAQLLDLKEGTVKSRLYHARNQLNRLYMSGPQEEIQ